MNGRLQEFCRALHDLRADALAELSHEEYEALVDIACEIWGAEAGRLFLGRLLRAERDFEDEAA